MSEKYALDIKFEIAASNKSKMESPYYVWQIISHSCLDRFIIFLCLKNCCKLLSGIIYLMRTQNVFKNFKKIIYYPLIGTDLCVSVGK